MLNEFEDIEEQDDLDDDISVISRDVRKKLSMQKKIQKYNDKLESKHKAVFHRINNENFYTCDNCNTNFKEAIGGKLMYNKDGEFAYCNECVKKLYLNYKPVFLANTKSKTKLLSNNFETQYSKGF